MEFWVSASAQLMRSVFFMRKKSRLGAALIGFLSDVRGICGAQAENSFADWPWYHLGSSAAKVSFAARQPGRLASSRHVLCGLSKHCEIQQ